LSIPKMQLWQTCSYSCDLSVGELSAPTFQRSFQAVNLIATRSIGLALNGPFCVNLAGRRGSPAPQVRDAIADSIPHQPAYARSFAICRPCPFPFLTYQSFCLTLCSDIQTEEAFMARTPRDVTERELAVLQALWDAGPTTIRRLTDVLYPCGFRKPPRLAESTQQGPVVMAGNDPKPCGCSDGAIHRSGGWPQPIPALAARRRAFLAGSDPAACVEGRRISAQREPTGKANQPANDLCQDYIFGTYCRFGNGQDWIVCSPILCAVGAQDFPVVGDLPSLPSASVPLRFAPCSPQQRRRGLAVPGGLHRRRQKRPHRTARLRAGRCLSGPTLFDIKIA
jgi:hypothetical protein